MVNFVAGLVLGGIGMLLLQAGSASFMDWWADVVDTARSWVMTILGVCGLLFIVCVLAYAAGWRP